jgi:acetyl esterase/lipase
MKFITIAFIFLLSFTACQRQVEDDGSIAAAEKTMLNESYGNDPLQKMDIYLPAGRTSTTTSALILIHGGAWTEGDKNDFADYLTTLKTRLPDYAIFNINYRLASPGLNIFPTQEQDVTAAMDFIYSNTDNYKVSKNIALLGASAGAHLALLQAYKYTPPVKVKAVVDLFGPTDLTVMYNAAASPLIQNLLQSITGATPVTNANIYRQSSPINFISSTSPATIILQGGADPLVDPSQSLSLKNKLVENGVVNQYIFYPNEGHGWTGANLTDSFEKIEAFLKANM